MQLMKWSALAIAVTAGTTQLAFASAQSEAKGFVEDSDLSLLNRNFYYNLDDRTSNKHNDPAGSSKQSYAEEWAHGVISKFESGFTQGTVGFGVDAYAMMGIKLDSGKGRADTGLLPIDGEGSAQDNYGEIGGAVKARISNTTLKYGEMELATPVYDTADSRLLPETTTGFLLNSSEIENLDLTAGHFTAYNNRASTNSDDVSGGYAGNFEGAIDFVGGTYTLSDDLNVTLYGSEVEDWWNQYYGNVSYSIPFSDSNSLSFNVNVYRTTDTGASSLGDIDGTFWSIAPTYTIGAHAFTVAYQKNNSDTPFDYIGGDSIYIANTYWSDFNGPNEKSYSFRYDIDLGDYITPGLTAAATFIEGKDIDGSNIDADSAYAEDWAGMDNEHHNERILEAAYTVQEGAAKDLSFTVVHNKHRGSSGQADGDIDRLRLIVEYPLDIL
jgi:imipenem/basic amino acid-specific outer membrane pore